MTWVGDAPVVAVALHHGHDLREEIARRMALDDDERRREEDPFTGLWATIADTGVVVSRSRFEVDLNRPRELAIYRTPAEAWGLTVWREPLRAEEVERSLALYDEFYARVEAQIERLLARHPRLVVLDLHSYNHRRDGAASPPAPADANPEINVGTGSLDRRRWGPLVDRFLADFGRQPFGDRQLDVRENVRFRGGHFVSWLHRAYPSSVCGLAIECKKFFMDEWSGLACAPAVEDVRRALAGTLPALLEELEGP